MVSKEGSRFFFYSASQTLSIGGANNFYFLACGSCEGWFLVTPRFKDQNLASGRSFPQKVDVLFPVGWLVGWFSKRGTPLDKEEYTEPSLVFPKQHHYTSDRSFRELAPHHPCLPRAGEYKLKMDYKAPFVALGMDQWMR